MLPATSACHSQITTYVRGKCACVAAPSNCKALELRDRNDPNDNSKAMCLLHWLVLKGNLASSQGKFRGILLLQTMTVHINVC